MKTRTSPRLQESLWRQLGGTPEKPIQIDREELAKRAISQPFLSQRTKRMFERDLPQREILCPICETSIKSPGSLVAHLETVHEDEWRYRKENPNDDVTVAVKKIFAASKGRRSR